MSDIISPARSETDKTEEKYVEVGQSVELKNPHQNTEDIAWKKDGQVCKMKSGKSIGNCDFGSIGSDGSLTVKNIKKIMEDDYILHNFKDGKLLLKVTYKLQVVDPIPKPNIQFICEGKKAAVCNVTYNKDLQFKWKLNGNDQTSKASKTYLLPSDISNVKLICIASFRDIQKESNSTDVKCKDEARPIDLNWMLIGGIAGGGTVLIILLTITIYCYCRNKKRQREAGKSLDLPVLPPTNRKRENPSRPHCNHPRSQSQPRTQTQTRPPPHQRCPPPNADQIINDEAEDHPPPRPRPRQKAPSYN
uniref:T-cell surface antigen CD2-like n=1 Tax=Erpetoichthys calabaricus TaxID=27687 RepID=A0A8C4RWX7_ERPCA